MKCPTAVLLFCTGNRVYLTGRDQRGNPEVDNIFFGEKRRRGHKNILK